MMGVSHRVAMALELEDKPAVVAPGLKGPSVAASTSAATANPVRRRPLPKSKDKATAKDKEKEKKAAEDKEVTAEGTPDGTPAPAKSRRGRKRLLHDEEQRKTRRKMQCKLNQRRYRARQRDMISTLSLETETVQDRIRELRAYTDFLRAYHGSAGSGDAVGRSRLVAAQFFRVFRHGFALHSVEASDEQERFLRQVAAPGPEASRHADALLLQLKRYSSYHATVELEPLPTASAVLFADADAPDGDVAIVLESRGTLRLRVSRDTVMLVYPHILSDEALSARVMGKDIAPAFAAAFHFDARARLARVELRVDFCAAFVSLLGSTEAAAALLGPALITRDGELGMDPHGAVGNESALTRGGSKQLSLRFILL